ncbi:hypothetical protein ACFRIC_10025 [Streptomyces sp. NPDC056738]|uniref:hypothetical protein n=1 Tax=Streptomyces sp. NPDC056738 TaxID=3345933 RepID=UPI0036928EEF
MSSPEAPRNPTLSPAAKAALDEAVREIGEEISLRAMTIANRGGDEETIVSVLDIAAALEQRSILEKERSSVARTLNGASILYGIIGLSLAIYLSVTESSSFQPLPLLTGMFIGAATPGIAVHISKRLKLLPRRKRRNDAVRGQEMLEILQIWLEVESAIRVSFGRQYGESRASATVSFMLHKLAISGDLDAGTISAIDRLRSARNDIAHARAHNLSKRDFEDLRRGARRALVTLQRIDLRKKEKKSL